MFGNIFNQKKDESGQAVPDAGAPVGQQPPQDSLQPQTPPPATQTANPLAPPSVFGQNPGQSQPPAPVVQTPTATPQPPSASSTDASALSHLDPRTATVLTQATEETKRIKQELIEPDQLLLGLIQEEQIYKMLGEMGTDGGQLSKEVQASEKMGVYSGQPTLSKTSLEVFDQAYRDAKMRGANFILPEDILVVLFNPNYTTAAHFGTHNLKKEAVLEKVSKDPNSSFGKKSVLEKYGSDLTADAKAGKLDPVAGRDKEVDRMVHVLLRRTKNNPIIIGEPGVGKTALIEGLAQKIVQGGVPKDLQEKQIIQLDVASLVAGASHRGEFEERLRGVITEVLASDNRIILFIDEIHALMGTGEGEGMSAANIIKPHLARGHFQLIGATTTIEYRKNFEKDKAFERRFQPVACDEPSEENAFEMLKVIRPKYEKFHRITIPDDALKECVKLSKKYIGERYLPDKAVDLLDEAASEVKLQIDAGARTSSDASIKKADIEKVVSAWTGIPITKLTEDESEKLLKLEDRIHHRMIDQEQAVSAVSEAVRRGRIGLAAANRPIASFVFLGPTGTGKTELAKTLAELLFGRDDAMARLDMSEYMEKHEVAKLIGAPPGYVGYEEGGQLTEAVRKKPYSIVLMDEIEKAHPDVFNIMLQLLEDGRLTDNKGNTISFKNTIVICTSNIGSKTIQAHLMSADPKVKKTPEEFDKSFKELQGIVREELTKFFRPELLNRFDEVVIFKPLQLEHMAGIARLAISKTAKLLKEQGFSLQITEKAVNQLAKDGYDPVFGARPLRRLVQTAVENPIALAIIAKKFVTGDTIVIDYNTTSNEFFFTKDGGVGDVVPLNDEQFRMFLTQVVSPETVNDVTDRQQFTKVHEQVVDARNKGSKPATTILTVTNATPVLQIQALRTELDSAKAKGDTMAQALFELASAVSQQIQASLKLKKILLEIQNPESVAQPARKVRLLSLHDKVAQEGNRDNALAKRILAVNEATPAGEIDGIMSELKTGANNGNDLSTEILAAVNMEMTEEAEAAQNASPTTKFKKVLQQLINPLYLAAPETKAKFSQLYDKLKAAEKTGNEYAHAILSLTDITSTSDIKLIQAELEQAKKSGDPLATELLAALNQEIENQPIRELKKALLLVTNPAAAANTQEREQYKLLQTKIADLGQKGNQLATAVLSVKETSTDTEMKGLLDQLQKAQAANDDVAATVMILVGGGLAQAAPQSDATPAPTQSEAPVAAAPAMTVNTPSTSSGPTASTPPAPAPTGATVSPALTPSPAATNQTTAGMLNQPAASAKVDSTPPPPPTAGAGGTMMQPAAYSMSGIPFSARRPINYISPQTSQEEIE